MPSAGDPSWLASPQGAKDRSEESFRGVEVHFPINRQRAAMAHSQQELALTRADLGAVTHPTAGGDFHCLVVATRASRREGLSLAARDGGWATISCRDASSARQCVETMYLQLAVVDLEGPAGAVSAGFPELVEYLASVSDLLLVVCGHEGRPHEELWVRQLGTWLYLPGLAETSELATLCGEVRELAARMSSARQVPVKRLKSVGE